MGINDSGKDKLAPDVHGEGLRIGKILAYGIKVCALNLHIEGNRALVRDNAVPALEEKGFAGGLSERGVGRAVWPWTARSPGRLRLRSLEPLGDKGRRVLPEEVRNKRRLLLFSHGRTL